MYPTLVVLAFAVIKWRDDKWIMGTFVKAALVACCMLIVSNNTAFAHTRARTLLLSVCRGTNCLFLVLSASLFAHRPPS